MQIVPCELDYEFHMKAFGYNGEYSLSDWTPPSCVVTTTPATTTSTSVSTSTAITETTTDISLQIGVLEESCDNIFRLLYHFCNRTYFLELLSADKLTKSFARESGECDSENGHRVALDSQSLQYSYVSGGQLIHHVAFERLDVGVLF
jgi:hypothetical protein